MDMRFRGTASELRRDLLEICEQWIQSSKSSAAMANSKLAKRNANAREAAYKNVRDFLTNIRIET